MSLIVRAPGEGTRFVLPGTESILNLAHSREGAPTSLRGRTIGRAGDAHAIELSHLSNSTVV